MANNTSLVELYNSLWELRDRRVDDWALMSSPWPTITLSLTYVYFVKILGPTMMKGREPFQNLKIPIQIYNVISVIVSAYVVYETWMAGWGTHYSWVCQDVERSADPNGSGIRMARIFWIYFISKFFEFFDTFFFIARKKFDHVSNLQVFHHGIMPVFTYCLCRWVPGGQESFGGWINSIVHVIMYSYYFMAMLGPQYQKYLWWKKYLTTFQMIQFGMIFTKSMIVTLGFAKCGFPWQFSLLTSAIMVAFFGLFLNFYLQNYTKKPKAKDVQSRKKVE